MRWRREIQALGISVALSKRSAGIMQETPERALSWQVAGRADPPFPEQGREAARWLVPHALIHEEPEYYRRPCTRPLQPSPGQTGSLLVILTHQQRATFSDFCAKAMHVQ